jgi:hypothetical protein
MEAGKNFVSFASKDGKAAAGKGAAGEGPRGENKFSDKDDKTSGKHTPADWLGHAANAAGVAGTVMQGYELFKGGDSSSQPAPQTTGTSGSSDT